MNNKNARILICILIVVLLAGCTAKDGNPEEFNLAIEKLSTVTTCHTSEELAMIYPDQEVVMNIDRLYASGDCLYTWTQNDTPSSRIVEYNGKRYDNVYYAEDWEPSTLNTTLPPQHLGFSPEAFTVEAVQKNADIITVTCRMNTDSKNNIEYLEANAEFILDADWNVLEYTIFYSYMTSNHTGEEFLLSIRNHIVYMPTEAAEIQQAIQDTFTEAQNECSK